MGPYPADEDPNASDFAAYCVEKTASELAVGNFVILSSGSWFNFMLEAAFIVHDINRAVIIMDRVLVSQDVLDS